MEISSIKDGIVLDHIHVGNAMKLYDILNLDDLECPVAIIKNADSKKMGKKDVLKIDKLIDIDLNIISVIDKGVTVNIIQNGKLTKHSNLDLPNIVTGVLKCKNPRCISSIEQELPQTFKLINKSTGEYRCVYCEAKSKDTVFDKTE